MTGFEYWLLQLSARASPARIALALWALAIAGALAGLWEAQWRWGVHLAFTLLAVWGLHRWTLAVRERVVRESAFPQSLKRRLREAYPHLAPKDCELAERGLRQFFLACLRSQGGFVAMPSRAADTLWHAFTQQSSAYQAWCREALGFVPGYAPATVLGKKAHSNDGLRRAWYWSCIDESIRPRTPSRLPLLFALDAKLAIPDGFAYLLGTAADGHQPRPGTAASHHYATSFWDTGYSGGSSDFAGCESHRRHRGNGPETPDAPDAADAADGD